MRDFAVATFCVALVASTAIGQDRDRSIAIQRFVESSRAAKADAVKLLKETIADVREGPGSAIEKAKRIKELEVEIAEFESPDKILWPTLPGPLAAGTIGRLPDANVVVEKVRSEVEAVVKLTREETTLLVEAGQAKRDVRKIVERAIVRGVATADFREGEAIRLDGVFEVKPAVERSGEKLFVLVPLDLAMLTALYGATAAATSGDEKPTPLDRLAGGYTADRLIDCSKEVGYLPIRDVDFAKSWTLSADVQVATLAPQWQILLLWGDERGGFDPFWFRIESGLMTVGVWDTTRDDGDVVQAEVPRRAVGRWLTVQVDFDAEEKALRMYFDGELVATKKTETVATADRGMPWRVGGLKESDQRFNGRMRNIRLANRKPE